jgi:sulfur-carrier protein adenylyltransferase/sulfurtransferase
MTQNVPEITVQELKARIDAGKRPFLLDVREPDEFELVNLDGLLIPLGELPHRIDELDAYRDEPVVVHCRSGARSARAVQFLQQHGFDEIYNLKGGILAWSREIDPSMPQY